MGERRSCGDERDRTVGLLSAIQALSQLSYIPITPDISPSSAATFYAGALPMQGECGVDGGRPTPRAVGLFRGLRHVLGGGGGGLLGSGLGGGRLLGTGVDGGQLGRLADDVGAGVEADVGGCRARRNVQLLDLQRVEHEVVVVLRAGRRAGADVAGL